MVTAFYFEGFNLRQRSTLLRSIGNAFKALALKIQNLILGAKDSSHCQRLQQQAQRMDFRCAILRFMGQPLSEQQSHSARAWPEEKWTKAARERKRD
jgi:hypothetical protein